MKIAIRLSTLAAVMAASFVAYAQTYSSAVSLPNITALTTYNAVPVGFDPVSAADSQLQDYGYPRRPDPSDARAYSMWLQAVSTTRIKPEFSVNKNVSHRPNQLLSTTAGKNNTTNAKSGNWSGYSLIGGSPFFNEVVGEWVVPSINYQFASFTGYESEWVGIDGNCNCNDLIQDGTEQDWTGGNPAYYAWIEFIPEPELRINNFPVLPGDVIYAYSSVGTKNGKVTGFYYIANYSTRKSVSASLAIPPNTRFSGLSAEWIMERTQVNGSFANPLPFYAYAYMADAFAYRNGSSHAIPYTGQANENIVMVQGATSLSKAYAQDSSSMWFQWLNYF